MKKKYDKNEVKEKYKNYNENNKMKQKSLRSEMYLVELHYVKKERKKITNIFFNNKKTQAEMKRNIINVI